MWAAARRLLSRQQQPGASQCACPPQACNPGAHANKRCKTEVEAAEILSRLLLVRDGARRGGERNAGDGLQEGREPTGVGGDG